MGHQRPRGIEKWKKNEEKETVKRRKKSKGKGKRPEKIRRKNYPYLGVKTVLILARACVQRHQPFVRKRKTSFPSLLWYHWRPKAGRNTIGLDETSCPNVAPLRSHTASDRPEESQLGIIATLVILFVLYSYIPKLSNLCSDFSFMSFFASGKLHIVFYTTNFWFCEL